jgi:catechol 2,3-dioxygenase-like lactoylglutathione lyase family enzyme
MAEYSCDHVHLKSRDARAAARFYIEAFGATPVFERIVDDQPRIAVRLGGLNLFIDTVPADAPDAPDRTFVGIEHICLAVKGLHAVAEELRARGVTFLVEPRELRPGVLYAFVQAPDGIRMELIDRGEG